MKSVVAVAAVVLVVGLAASAQAQSVNLKLEHVATFDSGFGAIALDDLVAGPTDPTNLQQIDVSFTAEGLGEGEDIWLVGFDVNLGSGLADALGWIAASGDFDHDNVPITPKQTHYQNGNGDFGTDTADLKVLLAETTADEAANRQYGEAVRPGAGEADALGAPYSLIGSVIVTWDGSQTELSVSPTGGETGSPWGIYNVNREPTAQPYQALAGDTLAFGIPEPASLLLLGVGLALIRRR